MAKILTFDLSLNSTGFAVAKDGVITASGLILARSKETYARMDGMREDVMHKVEAEAPDFIVMEDLAFSMNNAFAKENAGSAYAIRLDMWNAKLKFVLVGASVLKKFATGTGAAKKELVMKEVLRRWGHDTSTSDEADALALAYFGMALVGQWTPQIDPQRDVLATFRKANDLSWMKAAA